MYQIQTVDRRRLINGIEIISYLGAADCRVVKPSNEVMFQGTRAECQEYCRTHALLVVPV